jgi:ATP-dependent Clp protease ATP-binding subunit ClpC
MANFDFKDLKFELQNKKFGTVFAERFLFWDLELSSGFIFLDKARQKINKLIDFSAAVIGVAGLCGFLYSLYQKFELGNLSSADIIYFWMDSGAAITFFLFSLLVDLFIYYRYCRRQEDLDKIKKFKVSKKKPSRLKTQAVAGGLSGDSLVVLENAFNVASRLRQAEISPRHLFWALLKNNRVRNLFVRLNINFQDLVAKLKRHLADEGQPLTTEVKISDKVKEIMIKSYINAYAGSRRSVDVLDVLLFCYESDDILADILFDCEVTKEKMDNTISWFRVDDQIKVDHQIFRKMALLKPGQAMNKSYTAIATPTLDANSEDLTVLAKYGNFDICLNRNKEIKAIFDAFESDQYGVLLVGPVGVGKRAIVEGIAQLMVKEEVPAIFKDKRLVELDVAKLIGGVNAAEAEDRLMIVINEVVRSQNIVLFIDGIEAIGGITSGGEGSLDLSQVLGNSLKKGDLYCLATSTPENYTRHIENKSLGDILTTVGVSEPHHNSAIQILESKVAGFENKYGVFFDYDAIEQTVKLSNHYINDEFLPEKGINILHLAAVKVAKICAANPEKCFCAREDIAAVISDLTGIPVNKVSESEAEKLLHLEANIYVRMVGQSEAVEAVSASLRRARAELRESKRPIASFLFLGPTGVGKTELAKSVSEVYFGSEDYMIRIDMSEYQLADSVNKMIGTSEGALGYLTEAVRKKPFSLILLDEVEKAHPDILNLFLQMMDDGRLTDGQGRTINFTNSIIIATSNAGALYIEEAIKNKVAMNIIKQEIIDNQLNKFMRPELINRFDGVIVFKPLTIENMYKITELMLKKIEKSLAEKGVSFRATEEGVKSLSRAGFDPKFGARPLRRLLQDRIENGIANLVLAGELRRRDTIIINEAGEVAIEKAEEL